MKANVFQVCTSTKIITDQQAPVSSSYTRTLHNAFTVFVKTANCSASVCTVSCYSTVYVYTPQSRHGEHITYASRDLQKIAAAIIFQHQVKNVKCIVLIVHRYRWAFVGNQPGAASSQSPADFIPHVTSCLLYTSRCV